MTRDAQVLPPGTVRPFVAAAAWAALLASGAAAAPSAVSGPSAAAPPAAAATSADTAASQALPPEGSFAPLLFEAVQDGVPVRADAGFVFREVDHLAKGTQVLVDGRKGDWLHASEGWILAEHLRPAAMRAEAPASVSLVVTRDGARLRSTPGTDKAPVATLSKGQVLSGLTLDAGWWKLSDGNYVAQEMVDRRAPAAPPVPASGSSAPGAGTTPAAGATGASGAGAATLTFPQVPDLATWSLYDLHGVLFSVGAIAPRSPVLAILKQEMEKAGQPTDWTFLRLVIAVPPGPFRFNYSPAHNAVVVFDKAGERYGNVYVRGSVDTLPIHVRRLLVGDTVVPGDTYEGVLLFKPTLKPDQITDVSMYLGGRLTHLYRVP